MENISQLQTRDKILKENKDILKVVGSGDLFAILYFQKADHHVVPSNQLEAAGISLMKNHK